MTIQNAIEKVCEKEPFFSTLVTKLGIVEDKNCPTMGTDGENIYYSPDFLKILSDQETCGVVLHETLHCVFRHLWRREERDHMLWNVACVRGDTLITMANGTRKAIKDIKKGEEIIGYQDGKFIKGKILLTIKKQGDIMECSVDNNKLYSTKEHEIFTKKGFQRADSLSSQERIAVVPKGKRFCYEKLSNYVYCGYGTKNRPWLSQLRWFFICKQFIQKQINYQTTEFKRNISSITNSMGISSRDSRWRRNNNHSKNLSKILSSLCSSCQHQYEAIKTFYKTRFLWCFRGKRQQPTILENRGFWLSNRIPHRWINAFSYYKKRLSTFNKRIYNNSFVSTPQNQTQQENGRNISSNQEAQYKRLTYKRILNKRETVYDLVTTSHSYIANNIIVHNCDFAINTIVNESFPLPKGALLDMKYYGMSAEEIYDSFPKQSQSGGEGKDKKKQKGKGSGQKSQEWGDHSQWENGNGNGDKDKKDKKDKGKSLIEKLFGKKDNRKKGKKSDAQREATWDKAFKDQMLNNYGSAPESIKRIIEKGYYMPVLDWSALVSQLLSEDVNDYTFSMPDRRFMDSDFFLPGLASTDRLKDVIFAFDTSGSISEEQLRAFYLETMNLFSNFSSLQGWVAVCDASLHSFNTIDSQSSFMDFGFVGGGGTDFEPVFDRIKREGIQPKAVFYFTDTEGSFPQEKPNYPVFWLVMSSVGDQSERQVPFGTVIKFMPKYR